MHVTDGGVLASDLMATEAPCKRVEFKETATNRLVRFLARRNIRTERPNELDNSIGSSLINASGSSIKANADKVDDIFRALPTAQHCELRPSVTYKCTVYVVMGANFVSTRGLRAAGRARGARRGYRYPCNGGQLRVHRVREHAAHLL